MDSKHLTVLHKHNDNELLPKCVPLEYWKADSKGNYEKMHPGHIFKEKVEWKDFNEVMFLKLNNHMRKKGV